jgi:hypothetical protein
MSDTAFGFLLAAELSALLWAALLMGAFSVFWRSFQFHHSSMTFAPAEAANTSSAVSCSERFPISRLRLRRQA